jgi:prepilin-type N-terminal cleavage/methylation domain-containing protein
MNNPLINIRLRRANKTKGFTLVELSIVLVIIGLLIGGVLVGQSLIESVQINRLVSDLRQYEVAVTQFHGKFKQYPGDSSYFNPPGAPDGFFNYGDTNGDGVADDGVTCNGTASNLENWQVWAHLGQAEMLKGNYPILSPANGSGLGDCGGTHTNEDLVRGKLTPYTKLEPETAQLASGFASDKHFVQVYKDYASTNFYFRLTLMPFDTLALEKKLGVQEDAAGQQVGLTNPGGPGYCYDASIGFFTATCNGPDAAFGALDYFIAP